MKSQKYIVIIWFIISQLYSQQIKDKFTHFTEQDGLSSNVVRCIMQDHLGYIWIGTSNGVTRYDGYEFKNFTVVPTDTNFLQEPLTTSLYEDSKGNIWIGSVGGVTKYDRTQNSFRLFSFSNFSQKYQRLFAIFDMVETTDGNILCGTIDFHYLSLKNSLFLIDTKSNSVKEIQPVNDDSTKAIAQISVLGNDKYLISGEKGIAEYDYGKNYVKWYPFKEQTVVISFLQDDNDNLWLGTYYNGLIYYNVKDSTYKDFSVFNKYLNENKSFDINKITYDQKKNLYLATNYGLMYFNIKTKELSVSEVNPQNNSALHSPNINDVILDNSGSIWIANGDAGISKYDIVKNNFQAHTGKVDDNNSISPGWVSTIFEYKENEIWLKSDRATIVKFNPNEGTFKREVLPKNFEIFNIIKTSKGKILLGGSNGFYEVDPIKWKFEKLRLPIDMGNNLVLTALEVNNNTIWFGTATGLNIYNELNETTTNINFEVLGIGDATSNSVTVLTKGKDGNIWIGTNNGLFKYDVNTKLYSRIGFSKDASNSLTTQDVNSLYIDKDNTVWIGTWLGGLNKYNQKTGYIESFTQKDGLPSHSVQGILADEKNGYLWLSTFDGISRFDLKKKKFSNFGIVDGIHSNQFADGSALKTSNGLFIFGGSNGITVFNPNEIQNNLIPPKISITDLKLFGKSIKPGKNSLLRKPIYEIQNLTLNYDENDIEFDYFAAHFVDPKKNQFAYKLENYEDDWRYVGNQRSAIYPNLPHGEYVFHLKASNNNEVWNEEGVTLNLKILPPWWQTWWAYTFYFLGFIGILGGIRRFELDRRKEIENKKLLQLENDRKTKDLEQAKEIEKAYTELKTTQTQLIHSEKMASLGELTAGIAHEIKNPLNFVNNFSEVSNDLIAEMLEEFEKENTTEVKAIAETLKQNIEKINHHGKRADSIVKSMLLHSRGTSGEKTLTNINVLLEQDVNLAYHGMRALNKEFNITIEKDYDELLQKINVVPQDISRVFLNIVNNACYAANQKKLKVGKDFSPILKVSTKNVSNKVVIIIRDNGDGIPLKFQDKLFNPFFTTKPTGEGTGLGLSLSYDIIVKEHSGEISFVSEENNYTEFIITLPNK
ncbi:MAG: GHKL domain-containing protein [Ignavibacteriae bacterium]|nr:GHKL domain-containing protein [Ignavibacteriota bacterium]